MSRRDASGHAGDDALEVFALEAAGAHGMIGRGASALEDLDRSGGSLSNAGEHLQEVLS